MHILLIRSRTLCTRYSYARIRYAYVMHTLLTRLHTLCIRYLIYACIRNTYGEKRRRR